MDAEAFALATSIADTDPVPMLDWDAGFPAYRPGPTGRMRRGIWKSWRAIRALGGRCAARAAFWAARAHMQAGDPKPVVSLLQAAAKQQPSFYGLIAERMLGMDTADRLHRSGARQSRLSTR